MGPATAERDARGGAGRTTAAPGWKQAPYRKVQRQRGQLAAVTVRQREAKRGRRAQLEPWAAAVQDTGKWTDEQRSDFFVGRYDAYALAAVTQLEDKGQTTLHSHEHRDELDVLLRTAVTRSDFAAQRAAELDVPDVVTGARRTLVDTHDVTLRCLLAVERAKQGAVRMAQNEASTDAAARTAHYANIKTREAYHRNLIKIRAGRTKAILKPKYLNQRVWYIGKWMDHTLTGWGELPWRKAWDLGALLPAPQRRYEEELLTSFHDLLAQKYGPTGMAGQGVTHVVQWHLTVLRVSVPDFAILRNDRRLEGRLVKKHRTSGTKKRRRALAPAQRDGFVLGFLHLADKAPGHWDAVFFLVMANGVAWGTTHCFRVSELFRGGDFDGLKHWTVQWLEDAGIMRVVPGGVVMIDQFERKVEGVFTEEQLPSVFMPTVTANPIRLYQLLRERDPNAHPDHSCFRVGPNGQPPTYEATLNAFKTMGRMLYPAEADYLDFTDHCLRIAGHTMYAHLGADRTSASHLTAMAEDSVIRQVYTRRTLESEVDLQLAAATTDFTPVADQFGARPLGQRGPNAARIPGVTEPATAAARREQLLATPAQSSAASKLRVAAAAPTRARQPAAAGDMAPPPSPAHANGMLAGRLNDVGTSWAAEQLAAEAQEQEDQASAAALHDAPRGTETALQPPHSGQQPGRSMRAVTDEPTFAGLDAETAAAIRARCPAAPPSRIDEARSLQAGAAAQQQPLPHSGEQQQQARGRGRPRGSKNRPKAPAQAPSEGSQATSHVMQAWLGKARVLTHTLTGVEREARVRRGDAAFERMSAEHDAHQRMVAQRQLAHAQPDPPTAQRAAQDQPEPMMVDEPDAAAAPQQPAARRWRKEQPQQPSEKFCVFAAFDLGPQPPHDPELCRLYQFGQYHDWTKCKRKAGHVCCFCRSRGMPAGSHGCFKCPRGGKLQITKFKKENGLY